MSMHYVTACDIRPQPIGDGAVWVSTPTLLREMEMPTPQILKGMGVMRGTSTILGEMGMSTRTPFAKEIEVLTPTVAKEIEVHISTLLGDMGVFSSPPTPENMGRASIILRG